MELSRQPVGFIHQVTMVRFVSFRKKVGEYFSSSGEHLPFSKKFFRVIFPFGIVHLTVQESWGKGFFFLEAMRPKVNLDTFIFILFHHTHTHM